jgi:hypothetical protein
VSIKNSWIRTYEIRTVRFHGSNSEVFTRLAFWNSRVFIFSQDILGCPGRLLERQENQNRTVLIQPSSTSGLLLYGKKSVLILGTLDNMKRNTSVISKVSYFFIILILLYVCTIISWGRMWALRWSLSQVPVIFITLGFLISLKSGGLRSTGTLSQSGQTLNTSY